ncbi:hypothetical protein [Desulfotomaculum copahuensis]|uniref:Uncharacterized protein n=1 Tax=Desulfotomaculum copahuensis TaxID=1838280 RepID=A0A1B7LG02_9FIRM|nr:hypothetical protein [Desulfotomaculum copahuensis]OAT83492.1 hypothetical protein A6M21_08130 [Desulfotomaculum copahuensis]
MKEMMAKLVKETMDYPVAIKEITGNRIELEKRLSTAQEDEERKKLQDNLVNTDRELEWLRSRQTAAVATINLLAALIGAGKAEDAKVLLAALGDGNPEPAKAESKPAQEKAKDQGELKSGLFVVKEAKPGKKEGTIWAIASDADGAEYKICAKNGDGKTLTEAVGKQAKVKYRALGKDKLFAVKVEIDG